jgi:CheY-like chemotaxis protein
MTAINVNKTQQRPSILFVDDEPRLLSSLRRMIRPWREVVDAEFVNSGKEALELLTRRHFDVIVSDMRMPGMNGADLLKSIRRSDPEALRVVLSGQADTTVLLEALEATHRYLSKPCDIRSVEKILKDAVLGKFWVESIALRKHIALLSSLPCQSRVVSDFRYLISQNAPREQLINTARSDLGLSLRLIHLAHALVPDRLLTSAHEVIEILGYDLLSQGIDTGIINEISEGDDLAEMVKEISEKSQIVARYARELAEMYLPLEATRLERAGYLSGVGSLVLMSCFGKEFAFEPDSFITLDLASNQLDSRRVGAFLLTLWGLGDEIPRIIAGEVTPADTIQPARILAVAQHLVKLAYTHNLVEQPLTKEALIQVEPFLRGQMIFRGDK